jgi:chromosome partitioning protein
MTALKPFENQSEHSEQNILAIANQKGGVGKTTTAVNLATALSAIGQKVLLIDLDPQGNATTGLGLKRAMIRTSAYDILFEPERALDAVQPSKVPRLDVIPSSMHLSGAEVELVNEPQRETRLTQAIQPLTKYHSIIIDCPPSLNLLTLNAMVAAGSVMVPLQCEFYALEGLSQLTKSIERIKKHFNPNLTIAGIVLTMYDRRNKLSKMVEQDVRDYFGDLVYKTVIPRNVRLSEAPSYGLPAIVYDMHCPGSQSYIRLAKEIIDKNSINTHITQVA